MAATLALAGDTMLGRGVAEYVASHPVAGLFGPDLLEVLADADAVILNLECTISDRGAPRPGRAFHFRAPPVAVDALTLLGVRCVTLANNHALDFGEAALVDTVRYVTGAGMAITGAGVDLAAARAPAAVTLDELPLAIVGLTDHPADDAASADRAGVNYVDLAHGLPKWLAQQVRQLSASALVMVTPHWGPNMTARPKPYVRRAARDMLEAGASLVAGHSAHVFHGVGPQVLFDLGDFVDDYALDTRLRNDLGVLWLVTLDRAAVRRLEAVPLKLGYCHTALARGEDAAWVCARLRSACRALGTDVVERAGRFDVDVAAGWDLRPLPPSSAGSSVPLRPDDQGAAGDFPVGELNESRRRE